MSCLDQVRSGQIRSDLINSEEFSGRIKHSLLSKDFFYEIIEKKERKGEKKEKERERKKNLKRSKSKRY